MEDQHAHDWVQSAGGASQTSQSQRLAMDALHKHNVAPSHPESLPFRRSSMNMASISTSPTPGALPQPQRRPPSQMANKRSPSQLGHNKRPSQLAQNRSPSQLALNRSPSQMATNRSPSQLGHSRSPSFSQSRMARKDSTSSLRSVSSNQQLPSPRRPPSSIDFGRSPSRMSASFSQPLDAPIEEAPPLTAASVASEFFARELSSHKREYATSETIVIIHDACYGHRFSRPKTSKSSLNMIVERPERILAATLGVSAAYIRLGSRHQGGRSPPHPDRVPDSHLPFQIRKSSRSYSLTSPAVVAIHGKKWMEELEIMCNAAGTRLSLGMKELERTEDRPGSADKTEKPTFHEGDLYLCEESLNALEGAVGGVCDAIDAVFSTAINTPQRAFVAVRPPGHHCSSDWPSGFCWINNVHIGIEYAAETYGLTHAAIFDFDLHHGDGSQDITWERNAKSAAMPKNTPYNKKLSIGYYSMHDINSFPCEWGDKEKVQNASLCIDNAHGQSIWNVHLELWKTMDEFWALYENKYLVLLEKARSFLKQHTQRIKTTPKAIAPKAAIFISAGFDASEWEGAGMQRHAVNMPTEFYARFTQDIVKLAQEEGTAVDGRVISVLEGGYSDRALTSGVFSHLSGLCQEQQAYSAADTSDVANAMQRMNIAAVGLDDKPIADDIEQKLAQIKHVSEYDVNWWHDANLTALEHYITPPPPPPQKKAGRSVVPTYATPTASFTHKVVDEAKYKRTISSTMRHIQPCAPKYVPPPEVDWIVATHELSKLLIPDDRQTKSCQPEELAPKRSPKERQSGPPALPVDTGRQLRVRKAKTPTEESSALLNMDSITESMRRQTISDMPVSPGAVDMQLPTSTTRRSSQLFSAGVADTDGIVVPPVSDLPVTVATRPSAQVPKMRKPRAPVTKAAAAPVTKKENGRQPSAPPSAIQTSAREAPAALSRESRESTASGSQASSGVGPKRIHLKLGSREQSEQKTKERMEAEKRANGTKTSMERLKPRRLGADPSKVQKLTELVQPIQQQKERQQALHVSLPLSPPDGKVDIGASPVPGLTVQVPTPKATARHKGIPLGQPQNLHDDTNEQDHGYLEAGEKLSDPASQSALTTSGTNASTPMSPPVFTPTFMSEQSPLITPDHSKESSRASSYQRDDLEQYTRPHGPASTGYDDGHVQYQFNPQQPQQVQSGEVNDMVRQSILVHPGMVLNNQDIEDTTGIIPKQLVHRPHPVFTSTGVIPFAPAPARAPSRPQTSESTDGSGLGISSPGLTNDSGNDYAVSDTSAEWRPQSTEHAAGEMHDASLEKTPRAPSMDTDVWGNS
ncbi:histone deacetylase domain-containing protein [Delphinella strobiligena]|nr:histone deacetylase domain-containing protein [Delphinella strobiligena]